MKTKQLLVFGEKTFKVTVPTGAKVTFGPWSPPNKKGDWSEGSKKGTLRIYGTKKDNILACFTGVEGFRDLDLGYAEQVAKEEGATIWKDDEKGYQREDKVKVVKEWVDGGELAALPAPKKHKAKRTD